MSVIGHDTKRGYAQNKPDSNGWNQTGWGSQSLGGSASQASILEKAHAMDLSARCDLQKRYMLPHGQKPVCWLGIRSRICSCVNIFLHGSLRGSGLASYPLL